MAGAAIARDVGISASSCFNLLKTLTAEGLLSFDPDGKQYTIGLGVLEVARGVLGADEIVRSSAAVLNALATQHQVTVGLWRKNEKNRLTLVAIGESSAPARIHLEIGQRQPIAAGAAGRAWLSTSTLGRSQIANLFAEVRWQKEPDFEDYLSEVIAARTSNLAMDNEKLNRSIVTLASPVRMPGKGGDARHVLTASTFAGALDSIRLKSLGRDVVRSSDRLAAHSGESTDP